MSTDDTSIGTRSRLGDVLAADAADAAGIVTFALVAAAAVGALALVELAGDATEAAAPGADVLRGLADPVAAPPQVAGGFAVVRGRITKLGAFQARLALADPPLER